MASQLKHEYGKTVRLFVDNLAVAAKILPGIANVEVQSYQDVTVVHWNKSTVFDGVANVTLETFACELPVKYLSTMYADLIWINVDHLSAENWVPEFHGLNGRYQDSQLLRYFYFPGFVENAGGLIREDKLIKRRDDFQQSKSLQQDFWQSLSIDMSDNDLTVSLFSYANAPVEAFMQTLAKGDQKITVLMPFNSCIPSTILGNDEVSIGDCLLDGPLTVHILPFLNQDDYDHLLWACDINFVRGEDSWVRAIWAGKPFIWQPYWQTDNAHLLKLNAFLNSFYGEHAFDQLLVKLHESWSTQTFNAEKWQQYVENYSEIKELTKSQSTRLIQQPDLVSKLVDFCAKLAK